MTEHQQAVIRTRNGEVDDVVIDCDQVHLERLDPYRWSLIIYRADGDELRRVLLTIGRDVLGTHTPTDVKVGEDTIDCEREEQE